MAKRLDKILVIDVESTCWEDQPPAGQTSEIIEIGLCPVDLDRLIPEDATDILIKPQMSKVSKFCTELTTLTTEILEDGITFAEACSQLKSQHKSQQRTWASWGDYDRRQFDRQCRKLDVKYPFGITHLNIKNLFALEQGLSKEVGMDKALEILGLELTGTHHRAHDDAANIARILCDILKRTRYYTDHKAM